MFFLKISTFVALIAVVMAPSVAFSSEDADAFAVRFHAAVTAVDTNAVGKALAALEETWKENPELYLQIALRILKAPHSDAKDEFTANTLTGLCSMVFSKKCPGEDKKLSTAYYNLKSEIALTCFGMDAIRNDKASLIDVADFIGEIRSCRIPDYRNRGTARPGLDILLQAGISDANNAHLMTNPVQIKAYAKAVEDNKQDMLMNDLQLSLFRADRLLSFHLLRACSRLSGSNNIEAGFYDDISRRAKLTNDEIKSLQGTEQP